MPMRILLMLLALLVLPFEAVAQSFPDRAVRFIVPYPPAGGNDIVARLVGQKLGELWGQSVVIDNRPGAGGNIGLEQAARAAPDGTTLLISNNSFTINAAMIAKLPVDIQKDFAPIALLAQSPLAVVVSKSSPIKSIAELAEEAKRRPGALNYGSAGVGTPQHLAAELFILQSGSKLVHVPYRGAAPVANGVLTGEIQVAFATMGSVEGLIRGDQLRGLAVTTARRSELFKELPTVAEGGLPNYDVNVWYGLNAPANTPPAIVEKIARDLAGIMRQPDMRKALLERGLEEAYLDPQAFGKLIAEDLKTWGNVVRSAGIKAE
jgi:tripartite-type tricarboxylate transporter receptor subunit TctC